MLIYINSIYGKSFIKDYLIYIIKNSYINEFNRVKNAKIVGYLSENYSIDVLDVLDNILDYITVTEINSNYVISLDKNKKYGNLNYCALISLIDNGNLDVRGLNLTYKVTNFIKRNIKNLYFHYRMIS